MAAPRVETIALGLIVLVMMLALERVLNLFRRRRKRASYGTVS